MEEATQCARRGLALLRPSGDMPGMMNGLHLLAICLWHSGDFSQSKSLLNEALALVRAHPEFRRSIGSILNGLALVERETGDFSHVKQFFQEALIEAGDADNPGALAKLKHEYGVYLAQYGFVEEGERLVREGLRLIREAHEPRMEGFLLVNLALVTCKLGKYDEAEAFALEARDQAETLSMKDALARALEKLGRVALGRGRYREAQHYLKESLNVAWVWPHPFSILDALIRLAELYVVQGETIRAAEWLSMVRQQRGFMNEHRLEVERLLKVLREQLSEPELAEALERGREMKLGEVVQELLATP